MVLARPAKLLVAQLGVAVEVPAGPVVLEAQEAGPGAGGRRGVRVRPVDPQPPVAPEPGHQAGLGRGATASAEDAVATAQGQGRTDTAGVVPEGHQRGADLNARPVSGHVIPRDRRAEHDENYR